MIPGLPAHPTQFCPFKSPCRKASASFSSYVASPRGSDALNLRKMMLGVSTVPSPGWHENTWNILRSESRVFNRLVCHLENLLGEKKIWKYRIQDTHWSNEGQTWKISRDLKWDWNDFTPKKIRGRKKPENHLVFCKAAEALTKSWLWIYNWFQPIWKILVKLKIFPKWGWK